MIYRNVYLCDETGDEGDSSVRAGLMAMCLKSEDLAPYEVEPGFLARSPEQPPWNNPFNYSRDQLLPMLAGLKATKRTDIAKRVLKSTFKRAFFAQNIERDWPGSLKKPWPHEVDGKVRYFDFADILMPNHIGALILAAEFKALYIFLPICYLFHVLSLYFHSNSNHYEENQQISECFIYGTLKLFKSWNPGWMFKSLKYWGVRNEPEYHIMLRNFLKEF